MVFPTPFLFLLVLCIEDTQKPYWNKPEELQMCPSKVYSLAPSLSSQSVYPVFIHSVCDNISSASWPLLTVCLRKTFHFFVLFPSLSVFLICFNCISQAFWWYFSAFPTVFLGTLRQDLSVPSASYLHFFQKWSCFSLAWDGVLLVFQAPFLALVIILQFVKCKIYGEKAEILLCL